MKKPLLILGFLISLVITGCANKNPTIDWVSFSQTNSSFAQDKDHILCNEEGIWKVMEGVEKTKFTTLTGDLFGKDELNLYRGCTKIEKNDEQAAYAEIERIQNEKIAGNYGYGYGIQKSEKDQRFTPCIYDTEKVCRGNLQDMNYRDDEIKGADLETIDFIHFSGEANPSEYAKDKDHIFCYRPYAGDIMMNQRQILSGADMQSFVIKDGVAQDKNTIYGSCKSLGLNPNEIKQENEFIWDSKQVYFIDCGIEDCSYKLLTGMNGKTFRKENDSITDGKTKLFICDAEVGVTLEKEKRSDCIYSNDEAIEREQDISIENNNDYFQNDVGTPTVDLTPRIMMRPGKVNQHVDIKSKQRQSDSDGVSGGHSSDEFSDDYGDKSLEYCQKRYPASKSVQEYTKETIGTWKDRENMGNYTGTFMSYKCVQ